MPGHSTIGGEVKAVDNIGCVEINVRDIVLHGGRGMWTLRRSCRPLPQVIVKTSYADPKRCRQLKREKKTAIIRVPP
jgi:hypothetical protein